MSDDSLKLIDDLIECVHGEYCGFNHHYVCREFTERREKLDSDGPAWKRYALALENWYEREQKRRPQGACVNTEQRNEDIRNAAKAELKSARTVLGR